MTVRSLLTADPRKAAKGSERARSINLAMSARGIEALKDVDAIFAKNVLKGLIPMKGRMIHTSDGKQSSQLYGLHGEVRLDSPGSSLGLTVSVKTINSINRTLLNHSLLDEIQAMSDVELFFDHKLVSANFDSGKLVFSTADKAEVTRHADLTIGCDGAYSKVREQLMRATRSVHRSRSTELADNVRRVDFRQFYIRDAYLEISMPPGPADPTTGEATFALEPDHLHIWPRHEFMLIALANEVCLSHC